ncbi:hypothetical protein KC19_11G018000 [Ceratodon purpureus]|uniref:TCTP domain-containing protein n=1 Tax=Ceratodon purpureus TaxID=3225 RepID=A0A8T0GBU3_CERPU|nr:hypothetical protein KC19_11G018000 [Ceratodon purpureus]
MLVYQDLISGDELLSDSFDYKELFNGALWEVEGKWVVKGALDVDALIGANASAEGGGEDEGVNDEAVKVVDIVGHVQAAGATSVRQRRGSWDT